MKRSKRLAVICILVALSACSSASLGQSPNTNKQVTLEISALKDAAGACMVPRVEPDGGNVYFRLPVPGPGLKPDHWIQWTSTLPFQVMFEGLTEPGQKKPKSNLGDETDAVWTNAKDNANTSRYEHRLKLKTGNGNETAASKYSVRIAGCASVNDPVIIVGR
jgi:hypothetical protein